MFPGGKGGRCVGLTTLPPSCADCLEIWDFIDFVYFIKNFTLYILLFYQDLTL